MKRKLSLLLAMVLAMTMVMGIGVTAFADDDTNTYVITSGGSSVITKRPGESFTLNIGMYIDGLPITRSHYVIAGFDESYSTIVYGGYDPLAGNTHTVTLNDEGVYYFVIMGGCNGELGVDDVSIDDPFDFYVNTPCTVTISSSAPDPDPAPTPKTSSPAHVHNFQWQTITAPTQYADGLEGEVCSCGATRNTQKLSAYGYALNQYATPMINAAKAGQTITFELGEWNSFPKAFMEKIAAKSMEGVTFVFHYKWNHVKQEIKIPAGTPIDLNFDWYGPAKMTELYGAN